MTDELKPGHCHKCGLQLSDNPHPEAGKPSHYLQVGCPKECIPCLTLSRHQWAGRAMKAENELTHARKLLSATQPAAVDREAVVDDLSTLVVRLVRALRKASPDSDLPEKALGYLYRKNLAPSVLRGGAFGEFAAPLDKDASKPVVAQHEREAFEHWYTRGTRRPITAHDRDAVTAWDSWQARAMLAASPAAPSVEQDERGAEYGSTDFGYTFAGINLEEGDKRLMAMLVSALGTEHPAIEDLTALLFRAASTSANVAQEQPPTIPRDFLGQIVREAWVKWAKQQPNPKPSWLAPYDELSEADKEADRQIGEAVAQWALSVKGAKWEATNVAQGAEHPDDVAVDRFATAMKEKMAAARAKGRSGWQQCSPFVLSEMLRAHVDKGDPRDVANFCMMLWNLDWSIAAPASSTGDQE